MILRKHEQSVLQSLCSIYQHFLDLFISLYAIHIHLKCAKLKKIKAWKIYIKKNNNTKLKGEHWERVPNSTQNIDCLHRGGMPLWFVFFPSTRFCGHMNISIYQNCSIFIIDLELFSSEIYSFLLPLFSNVISI